METKESANSQMTDDAFSMQTPAYIQSPETDKSLAPLYSVPQTEVPNSNKSMSSIFTLPDTSPSQLTSPVPESEKSFLGSLFTKPETAQSPPASDKGFLGSLFSKPETAPSPPASDKSFLGSLFSKPETAQSPPASDKGFLGSLFSKPETSPSPPASDKSFLGSLFSKPETQPAAESQHGIMSTLTKPVASVAVAAAGFSTSSWIVVALVIFVIVFIFLQIRPYLSNINPVVDSVKKMLTGTIDVASATTTNVVNSTAEGSTAVVNKISGAKPKLPRPDDSTSTVQTKANYCYVGDWKGVRSCVKADGICTSGKVFTTESECVYPR